ncbi:HAMP domain-containing sensor histidine kinase [Chryseolinea sp. H1M3-3]|uniref:sensor histidine kinase n=1 Tax=Chryseolinea sp. H1M3-3 TaxID=3034144 RepID=UPI0023EC5F2D|nr:HAMP domain-containing sensor histidine kinase [Chryseolinea sp. H1M3-3]
MKNKRLQSVILLGTLILMCLLVLQVYWFKKAFDVTEKQFDHSVQVALKKVADSVSRYSKVEKVSSNFFFVQTNHAMNDHHVDSLLAREFSQRNLEVDYELGVYNAEDDTLVYGNYVSATVAKESDINSNLHVVGAKKNFAVYFPTKRSYITAKLDIWIFSTFILLLMVGFFAYAIHSLLREKKFSELKNDFVNNMTHEFKTPVTNIGIAGEILRDKTAAREDIKVYLDIVLKENEKLRQKIDQVLLGSASDHLKHRMLEVVDVHQLISDCADSFQLKIQERNGNLTLNFNASKGLILGDRDLLAQAINNVIDNAEKYSLSKPHISVQTRDCEGGIEIMVTDHGIGISKSMKSKVFEKFYRVPSGDVHSVKGFGLGLSFVKSIIRSHRGQISLFSELNKGTEVRIIFPKI